MITVTDPLKPDREYVVFDDGSTVGGTKQRLLSRLLRSLGGEEFVYAGPDGGIAQVNCFQIVVAKFAVP
jgi:hypothetical protein